MTRTFAFGNYSSEFKKVYNVVLKAHENAFENITSGITSVTADGFSRSVIVENGYGEYFTHGVGHGVGVKIHEAPRLSKKSESVLTSGNCFSIEPGVYIENKFGVRIEDTVYLSNDELTSFNELTKELFTVKP
jgi:Xaa-Pro aminopeptidase